MYDVDVKLIKMCVLPIIGKKETVSLRSWNTKAKPTLNKFEKVEKPLTAAGNERIICSTAKITVAHSVILPNKKKVFILTTMAEILRDLASRAQLLV